MEKVDCVVIGAGVVGLAIARALAQDGRDVIVIERAGAVGTETSGRSSEVIHAGLYYPADSWKARLCVEGRNALYQYSKEHGVPHRQCGKLVVAIEESELPPLRLLQAKAIMNGVSDTQLLDAATANLVESQLHCRGALLSPSTGIIDSHSLMMAYWGDLESNGGSVVFHSYVKGGKIFENQIVLDIAGNDGLSLSCNSVVNSAGLGSADFLLKLSGFPKVAIPKTYLCKGSYFSLSAKSPFEHLIYPLPNQAGLGIHLTFDLKGRVRFGPDVEWIEEVNYNVDEGRSGNFYKAVKRYWPELPKGSLSPDYAGIRPKTIRSERVSQDFEIQGPSAHGVPGLVNLFAIESPGITASLAIADVVAKLIVT